MNSPNSTKKQFAETVKSTGTEGIDPAEAPTQVRDTEFDSPRSLISEEPVVKEFGGYIIESELGRGGMGVVYLARQTHLNRRVALKMLHGHYGPEELKRFLEEAETAAGLHHNNIAQIYEVGEHNGVPFFSMEYLEAGSLADQLRKKLPSPDEAANLMISVARALHSAHQKSVIHRDMKPANILMDPDGVPKIADFGIAKRLDEDSQLTRTGAVIGTPIYMAPEQAKGNSRHVGPAADVYSLGSILYEMLAGRPPFLPEDSDSPITMRVLTEDPVVPSRRRGNIPRDLEIICLKCLEKEPRNRYVSAAAFAEDLRRFVDDESILAKAPNAIVKSTKWARRNPWKFVGFSSGALAALAVVALLANWELYNRPRFEYAKNVMWVNGGLETVTSIDAGSLSQTAAYVRLTRSGRFGPIVKAEVLNPRGNPAVLRRTFIEEMIPLYIEGIAGAQPYDEKLPETTLVEFSVEDGETREAVGRDRNGQVNWRIIYDRSVSNDSTARARFVNLRGFASNRDGASHMEFERDAKGRDVKIRFLNAAGKPAPNGEKVYGYNLTRDDSGRIVQLLNVGADGQPGPNRVDLTGFNLKWENGVRFEACDAQGQPVVWNGISAIVTELDSSGNPMRVSNLRNDGEPVRDDAIEWSVQTMKRNEHGELTQRTFYKANADGSLKQISNADISYDKFGHPADIKFTGTNSWHSAYRYDASGNVTEEKFLDVKGEPVAGPRGYAIKRTSYTSSAQGIRVDNTYFDAAGQKTYSTGGYHQLIDEFDSTGALRRQTMDEHDPAQYKYYRFVSEPEFDPQGRIRHSKARFEDAQGQLAVNAGLPYTAIESVYDENGRLTTEWKTGCDLPTFGGPVVRVDNEWNSNGKIKRTVRQASDSNRQPLSKISNGTPARYEEEFDWMGERERIYETGFDEALVGFSTREAKFSGGNLQSVIFTRSDGSRVNSVRVIITQVIPPESQPKSSELKPGDQLIAFNGKPIPSAYAWVYSGFPGGWIEVARNGRRVRIGDFNPGVVGIVLEDRATETRQAK
jgi:predicted Ser/Thr protein kinase